ncbi:MAG: hypothetical protein PHV59_12465 [Victivallales bacterium]|nr:hypothetical protein [Victivallales bacterium]
MGVFKKSGCVCLRISRLNVVGGSLELTKNIPNCNDVIIARQNADRPIQEVIKEAKDETEKFIDEKCPNPEHAEALKNGTGFWISNPDSPPEVKLSENPTAKEIIAAEKQKKEVYEKELKEFQQAVSVEVVMLGESRDLLRTLADEVRFVDPAILPLLGAAFEAGRCVERGIAGLLLSDAKRGKQVLKGSQLSAKQLRLKKQKCYSEMKAEALQIAQKHPAYSISQAAEKLHEKYGVCTKTIKDKCKEELASLNKKILK